MHREDHRLLTPPLTLPFISLDLPDPNADVYVDSNDVEGSELDFDDVCSERPSELSPQSALASLSPPFRRRGIRRAFLAMHILG